MATSVLLAKAKILRTLGEVELTVLRANIHQTYFVIFVCVFLALNVCAFVIVFLSIFLPSMNIFSVESVKSSANVYFCKICFKNWLYMKLCIDSFLKTKATK